NYFMPTWPYPNEPADAYADTVRDIFGDEPTAESIEATYRSGTAGKRLHERLTKGWETNKLTLDAANQILATMVKNNVGQRAIE
ncbi:MAG: hypothetical protein KDA87_27455, partial [Planctomycetales bacterium]|nr:hypothetical protein [Planctomycetales bacterium]